MLNILIIMTGEGVSNYEFKKALLHMCVILAAWVMTPTY